MHGNSASDAPMLDGPNSKSELGDSPFWASVRYVGAGPAYFMSLSPISPIGGFSVKPQEGWSPIDRHHIKSSPHDVMDKTGTSASNESRRCQVTARTQISSSERMYLRQTR